MEYTVDKVVRMYHWIDSLFHKGITYLKEIILCLRNFYTGFFKHLLIVEACLNLRINREAINTAVYSTLIL